MEKTDEKTDAKTNELTTFEEDLTDVCGYNNHKFIQFDCKNGIFY